MMMKVLLMFVATLAVHGAPRSLGRRLEDLESRVVQMEVDQEWDWWDKHVADPWEKHVAAPVRKFAHKVVNHFDGELKNLACDHVDEGCALASTSAAAGWDAISGSTDTICGWISSSKDGGAAQYLVDTCKKEVPCAAGPLHLGPNPCHWPSPPRPSRPKSSDALRHASHTAHSSLLVLPGN